MEKRILIFGSGYVAAPVIEYLTRQPENQLTVASNILADAEKLADGHEQVAAVVADVTNDQVIADLVEQHDIVISLVPYLFHVAIAQQCIKFRKHLITASYVSPEMKALDQAAKDAEILILNEIGLDPGIDHLSAMKVIDEAHDKGGKVKSFASWCGGLPAPEFNDNPLGYKFAWAPRGVLLALLNQAKFYKHNKVEIIESADLLSSAKPVVVSEELALEGYPNRDSTSYREAYQIPECENLIRGTLRYPGFCDVITAAHKLGLLDIKSKPDTNLTWKTYIEQQLSTHHLNLSESVTKAFEWLGLFEEQSLPDSDSLLDAFCSVLQAKLQYQSNETDMIALQHRFELVFDDRPEFLTSTLVVKGDVGGYSAMSKTVGYPVAIATQLILDGEIQDKGVHIPVLRHFYEPILELLEEEGIECIEREQSQLDEHFFL
ncbi:saccharopine dehydrogenase C-terminal domain-containing protein [Pleionea litopenaei]|uniref:Saccharopine dehydrogenase C-terminal domain-containing protein n=1 Tax=Pleionea litopenaei TaxID=3070815 RepID=A0AA51RTS8_9GAMM|nr:saccharopine dehydrogenase C-terminal domain-containing protein [Pleionea sp. HL-JVS1]WMS87452.1 saccharopine dehydrogenase C-terminal domain-containing protein [Pleionea sp. HL-JVS1]